MKSILPQTLQIRQATVADAGILAEHRAGMFRDMGSLDASAVTDLVDAATSRFRTALPQGEYVAWLIHEAKDDRAVVAGAGVLIRTLLPRPDTDKRTLIAGREALVMNVYVAPEFRRRGLARHLMETILAWAGSAGIPRVVLHASGEGRPLYESLGFVPTNEMRYAGALDARPA